MVSCFLKHTENGRARGSFQFWLMTGQVLAGGNWYTFVDSSGVTVIYFS